MRITAVGYRRSEICAGRWGIAVIRHRTRTVPFRATDGQHIAVQPGLRCPRHGDCEAQCRAAGRPRCGPVARSGWCRGIGVGIVAEQIELIAAEILIRLSIVAPMRLEQFSSRQYREFLGDGQGIWLQGKSAGRGPSPQARRQGR